MCDYQYRFFKTVKTMSAAEDKFLVLQSSLGELSKHNPQWSKDSQQDKQKETECDVSFPRSPVAIVVTEQAGRQLVAARHVSAGEVLFREPVLLPLVPKQSSGPACLNCLKTLPDESYPHCEYCAAPLCRTPCDGKLHSLEECQVISKKCLKDERNIKKKLLHIKEINTILTPLRCILMFNKYPEKQSKVGVLEANIKNRMEMNEEFKIEKKIVSVLQKLLDKELNTDEILRLCSCYDTNSFDIQVSKAYPGRARAVFLITSMMNHDCIPNTQHWYDDGFMSVRAAVDIPEGAAVTLSYSEVLWGTGPRQGHLLTSKFFNCCCQRCSSPSELGTHLSSVLCRRCGKLVEPPHRNITEAEDEEETMNCSSCSWTFSTKKLRNIVQVLGLTAAKVPSSNFRALHRLCGDVVRTLGSQHYTAVLLRLRLLQALDNSNLQEYGTEILREVLEISEALLQVADVIAPGISLFRGNILLRHVRIACELIARRKRGENREIAISTQDLLSRSEECKEIFKFQDEYVTAISEIENSLKRSANCKIDENSNISSSSLLAAGFQGTDRHLWYHLFL